MFNWINVMIAVKGWSRPTRKSPGVQALLDRNVSIIVDESLDSEVRLAGGALVET